MPSADLEIERSARECFQLACAVGRWARWRRGVVRATVLEVDSHQRGRVVQWRTSAAAGSLCVPVTYEYEAATQLCLRWSTAPDHGWHLHGELSVVELTAVRCRLRYIELLELAPTAPTWLGQVAGATTRRRDPFELRRWLKSATAS